MGLRKQGTPNVDPHIVVFFDKGPDKVPPLFGNPQIG